MKKDCEEYLDEDYLELCNAINIIEDKINDIEKTLSHHKAVLSIYQKVKVDRYGK